MKATTRVLLTVVGALITIVGIVFTLQGVGYVTGSFMTGATQWAVIGPVIAVAGLILMGFGLLRRRPAGGRRGS
ncbi:MAG: hypothetical protein ACRDPY_27545 [Streptosporangiaceae bacterium]